MLDIAQADLRRIDLNLLVVFGALLAERNATRTGQRLGMSQAAVSGALARLRIVFHDPLFVRAPGGLAPTPRATELGRRLNPALAALADVVRDGAAFDPSSRARDFVVGMSDDIEAHVTPSLVKGLLDEHPDIRIRVRQTNRHVVTRMLDDGDIDLGLAVVAPAPDPGHRHEPLFTSSYLTLFDPGQLDVAVPLTLADFLALPHVLVSFDGRRGIVDDVLDTRGLTRTVVTSTTHFAGAIPLLKAFGAIATIPEHAARVLANNAGLVCSRPPLQMPEFTVSLVWHETRTRDPANLWLRKRIRQVLDRE